MKIYIIQEADSFAKIAEENNIDEDILILANPQIDEADKLLPGMKMKIPQQRKPVSRRKSKTDTSEKKETNQIPDRTHHFPFIQEDDTWKIQPPVHERIRVKKKHNAMKHVNTKPMKNKHDKQLKNKRNSRKNHSNVNRNYALRDNPINNIRNIPHENIPEVNLLQVNP